LRIKLALERDPVSLLSIAGTVSNLAGITLARGDFISSRDYLVRSLEVRQNFLPDDSLDVAANLVNLGNVYHLTGDLKAAEEHFKRALMIYEKTPPGSSYYARTLSSLGNVAYDKKDYRAANDSHCSKKRGINRDGRRR
jgi:tetratricopeptide (TPR) repeat protein